MAVSIGPVAQWQSGAESDSSDNSHGRRFDPAPDHKDRTPFLLMID